MADPRQRAESSDSRSEADILKEIIAESGNSFHCKVANYFRAAGWETRISQYYVDASTDKAREIDLIVERAVQIWDRSQKVAKRFHLRLFIECKYIRERTVFWFESMDQQSALGWINDHTPLKHNSSFMDEHHYLTSGPEVAKLYCTEKVKGQSRAEESEPIFRALNQCLTAFIRSRAVSIAPPGPDADHVYVLAYPVIVCSGFERMYRTHITRAEEAERIQRNFLLEVNYAITNRNGANIPQYHLVDIVSFDKLDEFVQQLDRELKAVQLVA